MSIATYSDLQASIADWLHRSNLTSVIPDFITLAETEIFRKLRSKDNETAFSSTMATDGTLALPSSYIALKFAYINTTPVQALGRKPNRWIYENYPNRSTYGKPSFIAREGANFIFGPAPDSRYLVTGVYWKNIGPLSTSAHAIFTNNPDLYLYGSLLQAVPYLKDDKRVPLWQTMYASRLASAQAFSDQEEDSGAPPVMVPG